MCEATPSAVARAFGDVLHGARRRRNLEPANLAAHGRFDLEDLNKVEQGQVESSLSLLIRPAIALGVSPIWFLEEILSWINLNEVARSGDDSQSRSARLQAVGSAFTTTLLGSSDGASRRLMSWLSGWINELAKQGLIIISLPRVH